MTPLRSAARAFTLILALAASACGYGLQGTENALLEREGIRRVYIAPFENQSFKPGVESRVRDAVLRRISAQNRVRIVESEDRADAKLIGTVTSAGYGHNADTGIEQLPNASLVNGDFYKGRSVATEYKASLGCNFSLLKRVSARSKETGQLQEKFMPLWGASLTREKLFAGNNQPGVFGTTSMLINESEFERALGDLAESMTGDLHESIFSMF